MKVKVVRIYASAQMAIKPSPGELEVDPKWKTLKPKEEELEAITEDLAVEFFKWPVAEAHFDKAMGDLLKAVKEQLIAKGLLR